MNTEERYTKVNSSTAQEDQAGMSCGNSTEGPKTRVNPNTSESTSTEAKTKVNPASGQSNTGEKAYQETWINPNTSQDDFYSNSNEFSAGEIFADKYRVESLFGYPSQKMARVLGKK